MAILEFGTWGRIDCGGEKGNRAPRGARSVAAIEGDRRLSVPASVAVARQVLVAAVLDAEHGGERNGEPSLRDRGRHAEVVRRIGEGDVVGAGVEVFDEA